jgi:hypothetical protein
MRAAHKAGFLPWVGQADLFDLEEYRHYEQVQNGDLNWVIPNKIIAFAGPSRKNEVRLIALPNRRVMYLNVLYVHATSYWLVEWLY